MIATCYNCGRALLPEDKHLGDENCPIHGTS